MVLAIVGLVIVLNSTYVRQASVVSCRSNDVYAPRSMVASVARCIHRRVHVAGHEAGEATIVCDVATALSDTAVAGGVLETGISLGIRNEKVVEDGSADRLASGIGSVVEEVVAARKGGCAILADGLHQLRCLGLGGIRVEAVGLCALLVEVGIEEAVRHVGCTAIYVYAVAHVAQYVAMADVCSGIDTHVDDAVRAAVGSEGRVGLVLRYIARGVEVRAVVVRYDVLQRGGGGILRVDVYGCSVQGSAVGHYAVAYLVGCHCLAVAVRHVLHMPSAGISVHHLVVAHTYRSALAVGWIVALAGSIGKGEAETVE